MTDHSTKSNDWALSVAADSIQRDTYGQEACAAVAASLSVGRASAFAAGVGRLYQAATTPVQRRAVVAVAPELFRAHAMLLGHEFSLERAGFSAPKPGADQLLHVYQHSELGRLECHISVELAEGGNSDCPPDSGDVQVEAVWMGSIDMTERVTDEELRAMRMDFCLTRGWVAGSRIHIPAGRITLTQAFPDCSAMAKRESSHAS